VKSDKLNPFIHTFIHSDYFYSAYTSQLLHWFRLFL